MKQFSIYRFHKKNYRAKKKYPMIQSKLLMRKKRGVDVGNLKNQNLDGKIQLHYSWIIAFTGVAVLFSCLGLGRFSLGMLVPSMGISLHLNYSQMGLIGTGNFVGYMISVVLAGIIAKAICFRRYGISSSV